MLGPLLVASHTELHGLAHKADFPDQAAITAFLRGLMSGARTQVTWAEDADVKYNTLTNWFTEEPPRMSAESLLRLVIAARAEDSLADWLRGYGTVQRRGAKRTPLHPVNGSRGGKAVGDEER